MKWKFFPNYLGRCGIADAETNAILLDTHTTDPTVAKACELAVELHNKDVARPALTHQQQMAVRYAIKLTEAQAKAMQKKGLPVVNDYFAEQLQDLRSILEPAA